MFPRWRPDLNSHGEMANGLMQSNQRAIQGALVSNHGSRGFCNGAARDFPGLVLLLPERVCGYPGNPVFVGQLNLQNCLPSLTAWLHKGCRGRPVNNLVLGAD